MTIKDITAIAKVEASILLHIWILSMIFILYIVICVGFNGDSIAQKTPTLAV